LLASQYPSLNAAAIGRGRRLNTAARQSGPDRLARMRTAVLDPLKEVYGAPAGAFTSRLSTGRSPAFSSSIAKQSTLVPKLRPAMMLTGCGHWSQVRLGPATLPSSAKYVPRSIPPGTNAFMVCGRVRFVHDDRKSLERSRGAVPQKSLLEPAGLVEILQRAVQVAFGAAPLAPVVEGEGIVRLEPDGLGVILQRAVQVAFVAARDAPVEEGVGIVWLEPDGLG
jgi:hypothetical protein